MKELKLNCELYKDDFTRVYEHDDGNVAIFTSEIGITNQVVISKDQAKQLRDWLYEFLGE